MLLLSLVSCPCFCPWPSPPCPAPPSPLSLFSADCRSVAVLARVVGFPVPALPCLVPAAPLVEFPLAVASRSPRTGTVIPCPWCRRACRSPPRCQCHVLPLRRSSLRQPQVSLAAHPGESLFSVRSLEWFGGIKTSFTVSETVLIVTYSIQYALFAIDCTIHCTLYTVHCTMYTVYFILYKIHFILYNIQLTIYRVPFF